jgi:hypothetical protein
MTAVDKDERKSRQHITDGNSMNRLFPLKRFPIKPARLVIASEAKQSRGPPPLPYDHWIASSLRSSQ